MNLNDDMIYRCLRPDRLASRQRNTVHLLCPLRLVQDAANSRSIRTCRSIGVSARTSPQP
jgi:hypothetical protein